MAGSYPMKRICESWLANIDMACKVKHDLFGKYADEGMRFYDGAHDWMWKEEYATNDGGFLDKSASDYFPKFRMTVNRVFEAVALFGPALYHQYPQVLCTPILLPQSRPAVLGIDPMDPMGMMQYEQIRIAEEQERELRTGVAEYQQHYLNWLQVESNKQAEAHRAITEAVVKGMGLFYTEMYQPRGSRIRYPVSRYKSVDDYVKDPDAQYDRDVQWIAIRHRRPVNVAEQLFAPYGLEPGSLKGHYQSRQSQVTGLAKREAKSNKTDAKSFDIVEYWEVYSKNGFGDRLRNETAKKSDYTFEEFGDFCRIVVCKGIPYPLNCPPALLQKGLEAMQNAVDWPTPFYADDGPSNGWPVSELWYYDKPKQIWPISLIKPGIGELRFINWCMSFLADKVAQSCQTYVAVLKSAAGEIQAQLTTGKAPFTMIELSETLGKNISEIVSFLQAPTFSIDIWKMVAEVSNSFDKRTGLTELIYGLTGRQMRSAAEAEIKDSNTQIRPDQMSRRTEDWLSESSLKEMEAAAWHLDGQMVAPVIGEIGASVWDNVIRAQDFDDVVRKYKYRIAAGSARKPNKANRIAALNEFGQTAVPVLQEFARNGIVQPWNAWASDMADALELPGADRYMVPEPPPMPMPAETGQEPSTQPPAEAA